jgi:TPP-dependent pyruvate/acetoin dehydrogenase alpha subunit
MHLFDAGRRFYGGNAIVAGGIPVAVGLALADKLLERPRVTLCLFGDGAVAEGEFHESLNLATLWKLPVLFLCENNQYAMGTHIARHQSRVEVQAKAAGYGIASAAVDGMDLLAVRESTAAALAHIRRGDGPFLLEARTYRFRAHSMYDAELYRAKDEVEKWKLRDPIPWFVRRLSESPWWSGDDLADIESRAANEIGRAVAAAEASPWEPVEELTRDVYTPIPSSRTARPAAPAEVSP